MSYSSVYVNFHNTDHFRFVKILLESRLALLAAWVNQCSTRVNDEIMAACCTCHTNSSPMTTPKLDETTYIHEFSEHMKSAPYAAR